MAAIVIAAAAPVAVAQDFRGMSLEDPRIDLFQSKEPEGLMASVSLQGRWSVPLGRLDFGTNSANYVDAFHAGLGVQGEVSLLFPLGRKWHIGPYLALGWDGYDGDTARFSGDTLRPDRLELTTFLVGPRFLLQMGRPTQLDLHMAFGAAHYSKVEGTFTPSAMSSQKGVILMPTTKFAFDLGTRFNMVSGPVFFDLGFDFRTQSGPRHGDLPVEIGSLYSFGLEFGAGVHF